MEPRLGAYVLTGDPEWLGSSLSRYYGHLDDLVILIPDEGVGWNGHALPVEECLAAIRDVDTRGIARTVRGSWVNMENPRAAQVEQRQAGINALQDCDWVVQLDNDEVVPDFDKLLAVASGAAPEIAGLEWPMRVIYRRTSRTGEFLAVTSESGSPIYEYPGPVLVRPHVRLSDARRFRESSGWVLRCLVKGDRESLQVRHAPGEHERREVVLTHIDAIVHNSWGRSSKDVWRKMQTSGHSSALGGARYYLGVWWASRWTWRLLKNFHPFSDQLWPRLSVLTVDDALLLDSDL